MLLRILFILIAAAPLSVPAHAGWFDSVTNLFSKPAAAKPPKIRVLVVHDEQGVVIEVKGKYKLYDPHNGDHISTRFVGKRKIMQAIRDGIKWGEEFPGLHQLMIVPDESSTTTIVDGIEYKGPIFVYDIGGTISVINEVSIEDFLSSTLAQRYRQKMPEELMAAVAIAARTNAYYVAANPKNQYWSIDAGPVNYQGSAVIDTTSDIENAIAATKYMVMSTAANGNQVSAFPAEWKSDNTGYNQPNISKISLDQAAEMAKKGEHAAQILMKAFPGVRIELIHYPSK
jgi:stage II sporulation protein D